MRRGPLLLAAVVAATVPFATPADAIRLDSRIAWISASPQGGPSGGESFQADISANGRVVAFTTSSSLLAPGDLNGAFTDVVAVDRTSGERRLVSAPGGIAPDGPSGTPSLSRDGRRVAFASAATNLVPGDANGVPDLFYRDGSGAIVPVSVRPDGRLGNRASRNPRLSADGRYVAFESDASDLVDGDSNGQTDVFLRDLQTGSTQRVSVGDDGTQGRFASTTPAISGDGRVVSFESSANTLVPDDTNRQPDVFVRDLRRGRTERISVTSDERQQNRGVRAPFRAVSDLDRTGRRVVFESEATNLSSEDTNRRTDLFLRDRRAGTTRLISASTANVQGNNDSVTPVITPDGRYVAFQSYATNLVPRDTSGPDVMIRDLRLRTTTSVSVPANGSRRRPARKDEQPDRPAIADSGEAVAFASTAREFVAEDRDAASDVFVRRLDPPATTVRRRSRRSVVLDADDPRADRFVCRVDLRAPFTCGPTVSLVSGGRRLTVRAYGAGMLADPEGRTFTTLRDRVRPRVTLTRIPTSRAQRTVAGRASDRGGAGVDRVEVAITFVTATGRCFYLEGGRYRPTKDCKVQRFVNVARGRATWRLVLPKLPTSFVGFSVRSVDAAGNRSSTVTRTGVVR